MTKTKSPKKRASKSAPKRAKSAPKPKPKSNGKSNGAKSKSKSGNGNGRLSVPRWEKAAALATALVTVSNDGSGKPINRAPISTAKVDMVHGKIVGRKSASAVVKSLGFKSAVQCGNYAGGKIGRTDLPDGVSAALTESARKCGDPAVHKINGRALAAIIFALTK